MNDKQHYFRLGIFVVASLVILFCVLFILGARSLFEPSVTFETYFDGSVAGLELGAPVEYRGVPLGHVSAIAVSSALYEADVPVDKRKGYIVVRATLTGARTRIWRNELDAFVNRGLRVQTQLAGITGQQRLAVDFLDPQKHHPLPFDWKPDYPYVPSAPSLTSQIIADVQKVFANLDKADIQQLGQNLNALVVNLNKKLDEVPVAQLSAEAMAVLKDARATIDRVDRVIAQSPIDETVRNLSAASAPARRAARRPRPQADRGRCLGRHRAPAQDRRDRGARPDREERRSNRPARRRPAGREPVRHPRGRPGPARDCGQFAHALGDHQALSTRPARRRTAAESPASEGGEMSAMRLVAAACAAMTLGACSIGDPVPNRITYVVEPPLPAPAPAAARRPETLRMGNVRVAPAFAGSALVYRMDDVQFTPDFYHAFIAEPGPMLGGRMAEWLDRAGPFKTVTQPGGAVPAPYALEAMVTELYGDFRPGQAPAAVMTVQFALVDLTGATPTVVLERFIGRRVDIRQASPDALVRGYGQALGEILAELASPDRPGGPEIATRGARRFLDDVTGELRPPAATEEETALACGECRRMKPLCPALRAGSLLGQALTTLSPTDQEVPLPLAGEGALERGAGAPLCGDATAKARADLDRAGDDTPSPLAGEGRVRVRVPRRVRSEGAG